MTLREYYEILKREWEKVNKADREAIRRYNEMKRELRHLLEEGGQS